MAKPKRKELQRAEASRKHSIIAALALAAIGLHLLLRFGVKTDAATGRVSLREFPLIFCLVFGGLILVVDLLRKLLRGEFGSDLLAGISIVTSVLLGEYLAGSLVVLMLSGGEALEAYAVRSASSVLAALATPHALTGSPQSWTAGCSDVSLDEVAIGDIAGDLPP